eukprot:TRINITY_DN1659_c0_g1_i1.p1 TRINITY_DN1659_c0_g1~~TRINITY_DN1659_c0_g1_i1.p1  ORF type:complete len:442 (+),score=54.06 TRINITY_DN1659_c0_g1_i1:172-1326(+)
MSEAKNIVLVGSNEDVASFCESITSSKISETDTELNIESIGRAYLVRKHDIAIDSIGELLSSIKEEHKQSISCIILLLSIRTCNSKSDEQITSAIENFEKVFGEKIRPVVCVTGTAKEVITREKLSSLKKITNNLVLWNTSSPPLKQIKKLASIITEKSARTDNSIRLAEEFAEGDSKQSTEFKVSSRHVYLKYESKASLLDGLISEVLNLWEYYLMEWSNVAYILMYLCFVFWITCFYYICEYYWKYRSASQFIICYAFWLFAPYFLFAFYSMYIPRYLETKVSSVITIKNSPGFNKVKVLQTETYLTSGELYELSYCNVTSEGNKIKLESSIKIGWFAAYNIEYDVRYKICLLYTSDAADDMQCVDLGGRRIIKKKKKIQTK